MKHEAIMTVISIIVLLASFGLLALSIWKRERLTSEAAWDRLNARPRVLRLIFALSFVSLLIFLFSESAELVNLESPSATLEGIHEIGETIHMFIAAVAVLAVIPLFSAMLGGEDAP